jgi:arginine repressor
MCERVREREREMTTSRSEQSTLRDEMDACVRTTHYCCVNALSGTTISLARLLDDDDDDDEWIIPIE